MTTSMNTRQDPIARHTAEPDVTALASEFELARQYGEEHELEQLHRAEMTRYNRWEGQSTDGLLWQKNQGSSGTRVRPWDGRPDTRQPLADGVINSKVDLDVVAFWSALIKPQAAHTSQLTAAQASELTAIVKWMRDGPLRADLIEGVEYLSQMRNMTSYAVLMPYWRERYGLRREELSFESFAALAQAVPEGHPLRGMPVMIADPLLEDQAVGMMGQMYPYLKVAAARRIVRELREEGATEFLYRDQQENRPAVRVLVPGVDIFLPEETQNIQDARCAFIRTYYTQVGLEAMAVNAGWDEEFIAAAVETAGLVSGGSEKSATEDTQSRRIEIIEALVRQTDEEGVPGIFCTVFSPHVGGGGARGEGRGARGESGGLYGKHYLLDYAHGQFPLVLARAEVLGPRPSDARGVPEIVKTQQGELKRQRDALAIRSELETTPPRVQFGSGWSQLQEQFVPGGVLNAPNPSAKVEWMQLGGNPSLSLQLCEQIQIETDDYFGLPNARTETHPARWQARQLRATQQWLLAWGRALWQLAVLCYDEYKPEELQAVLGRPALLRSRDLLQHTINLSFDARTMDQDWTKEVLTGIGMIRSWNTAGTIDDAKLVQLALSLLDPTLAQEITVDQRGAASAIYKEVQADLQGLLLGFKPVLVENDASAGQKLQFAQQIGSENPEFAKRVMPKNQDGAMNPFFQVEIARNFETYMKNLEHNVQEMVTSKVQGRLGVADVQGRPAEMGK